MAQDLSFAGSGTVPTGEYGNIHCSGSCRIIGDIKCKSIHCSGSTNSSGEIEVADEIHISGSFASDKGIKAGTIRIAGSSRISGIIHAQEIRISGSIHAGSDVSGENIQFTGSCNIDGNCEAEYFKAYNCNINGLLNAGNIEIKLNKSQSKIGEIGGGNIIIRTEDGNNFGRVISFFGKVLSDTTATSRLLTSSIEGDDIYIENTTAETVRGTRVSIGPNCIIGKVEYKQDFESVQDTEVKEIIKI